MTFKAVNRLKRFSCDELNNCNLMHISLDFPNLIMKAPEIRVITKRIILQYDTTFNLTSLYTSILNMIHPYLINTNNHSSPPIPIAEYFHELKTEQAHEELMRFLSRSFPEINEKCAMITDCEKSIRNAIKTHFHNMPLLRCWNHL